MIVSSAQALTGIIWLVFLSTLDHSVEYYRLKKHIDRVWRWRAYEGIELLRWLAVISLVDQNELSRWAMPVLLVCHIISMLRWRGSFNGGSDAMYFIVLVGATIAMFSTSAAPYALAYICFHLLVSYVKPGFMKLRRQEWRSGQTLRRFLLSPKYEPNKFVERLTGSRRALVLMSWAVMLFEVSFPLGLLHPWAAWGFVGVGVLFHLGNSYLFGLNRFFWAWLCAYPAYLFCASTLTR